MSQGDVKVIHFAHLYRSNRNGPPEAESVKISIQKKYPRKQNKCFFLPALLCHLFLFEKPFDSFEKGFFYVGYVENQEENKKAIAQLEIFVKGRFTNIEIYHEYISFISKNEVSWNRDF